MQKKVLSRAAKKAGCPKVSSSGIERFIRKILSQSLKSSAEKIQAEMAYRRFKISEKTTKIKQLIVFSLILNLFYTILACIFLAELLGD